jgi:hypothetical protein
MASRVTLQRAGITAAFGLGVATAWMVRSETARARLSQVLGRGQQQPATPAMTHIELPGHTPDELAAAVFEGIAIGAAARAEGTPPVRA